MATLTYDPSETQEGELTPDEQNSLAIGEALEQEQEQLLAGKFSDTESLERGYLELQQKLGEGGSDSQEEVVDEKEDAEDSEEDESINTDFLNTLWEEAQDEYSQETLDKLSDMDPGDLAEMYLQYRYDTEKESAVPELTDDDVNTLKEAAGGEDTYNNMMSWANESLAPEEIQMYDAVMEQGNPLACFFAVKALSYRFDAAGGTEGTMLTGKASSGTSETFRSQAEVVRAMSDPRYDNDPAYRQDIYDKLERSPNLNF